MVKATTNTHHIYLHKCVCVCVCLLHNSKTIKPSSLKLYMHTKKTLRKYRSEQEKKQSEIANPLQDFFSCGVCVLVCYVINKRHN